MRYIWSRLIQISQEKLYKIWLRHLTITLATRHFQVSTSSKTKQNKTKLPEEQIDDFEELSEITNYFLDVNIEA